MLDGRVPTLRNQIGNLVTHSVRRHRRQVREGLPSPLSTLVGLHFWHFPSPRDQPLTTSSLSTVSNSNLISFQVSIAILSSGDCCAASVRISRPSRSTGRP